jgi:hypothetical protein
MIATTPEAFVVSATSMQPAQSGLPQKAHTTAAGTSTQSSDGSSGSLGAGSRFAASA